MFCVQLNTLHKCAESSIDERLLGMFTTCLGISTSYMVRVLAVHWRKHEPCFLAFTGRIDLLLRTVSIQMPLKGQTIVGYSEFNLLSCMGAHLGL
jgi:hypothetical protein